MTTELTARQPRKTGISVVGDVRGGTHFCYFGETNQDLWIGSRDISPITGGLPGLASVLRLALLILTLLSPGAVAQPAGETPRTIRVVMDNAYAPYSFQLDEGRLQGILIDQWHAWEKKTGIKAEIHAMDWGEALRRMRAGEFDVIDSIVETAERRGYFDFTPAYTPIEASIFFRNEISGIIDLASLKGFPVGVKAGDQHIDKLKANGVTTVILFQSNDAIIKSAKQHKINVFVVDNPSALYLLNKMGIAADFRHSAPIFRDELKRAVHKGDAALLRTVTEGFAAISPGELKQIDEKWFGRAIIRIGRFLTYAGYAAAAAALVIAGLAAWNRTLRKSILQRTAALSESEQRFRRLVELMPVAVYVCYTSGIIQSYNNRAIELWGREPKPGDTAQRYCGSLRLYSPDGKLVPHEESKMAEVLRTGVPARDVEVVIERPDGSRITVLANIAPLRNADGELIGAMNCFQDITARKLAETVLKQAEDRIQLIIDTIPAMVWSVRTDGVVDFLNQPWIDYAGLSLEEYIKDPTGPIHPEDVSRVMEMWRASMAAGERYEDEMRLRRADGEYRWFLVRSAPLRDGQGRIVKWFGSSIDIEDRKEAEEALRQSEERFAAFMDNLPGYAWMKDLQGRYVYVNKMVRGLPGYRSLGKTDAQIWPADLAAEYRAKDQQVIASKKPLHTVEHFQQEGKQRYMVGSKFPIFDKTGAVALVGGAGVDITERIDAEEALRQSEQRLRTILRTAMDGFWRADARGRLLEVNEAYCRMSGYSEEDLMTMSISDLEAVETPVEFAAHARKIIERGEDRFETQHRRKDGSSFPVEVSAQYKTPDGGQIVAFLRDITERKKAEDALKNSHAKLRALSARLQSVREEEAARIAREIHDDLGQKLTVLKMDLLRAERKLEGLQSSPAVNALLDPIVAAAELADSITASIQEIAANLRPGVLDKLGLGAALQCEGRRFQERTGILCEVRLPETEPDLATESSTTLFRIVQECLTNIVRHADATKVIVELKVEEGWVTISAQDNGRGITEAELANVSSLGLLGMKERAVLLGGEVTIQRSEDRGTIVTARLPQTQMSFRVGT